VAADQLADFFDQALTVFSSAAQAAGGAVERDHCVAGLPWRVRYAGARTAQSLGVSLLHLAASNALPELTVHVWGGDMQAGRLPPPPWDAGAYFERGNVRGLQTQRFALAYDRRAETFSAVDLERGIGIYWLREAASVNYRERATPMRRVLQAWLHHRGLVVIHAAAVGRATGGVLLAGRTGSGKSTTALASLRAGLAYAGDDYVPVMPDPAPSVHGLYSSAKLNPAALGWLPELEPLVANAAHLTSEKALIFLAPDWQHRLVSHFPLRALLLPVPSRESHTRIEPVSWDAAYKAIAPDTLFSLLGSPRHVSAAISRLVRVLPCYRLLLGTDMAGVSDAVAQLVERHAQ
jgi:hypothetical protein